MGDETEMAEQLNGPEEDKMHPLNCQEWDEVEVASYFASLGYPEYEEIWHKNELDGNRLTMITVEDFNELEIGKIGHKVGLQKEVKRLKVYARMQSRRKKLVEIVEAYDGSGIEETCYTCCGICPRDPSKFILTPATLKIKTFEPERFCGMCKCRVCGGEWSTDNMTLSTIVDIDTIESTSGCCCCTEHRIKLVMAVSAGGDADDEHARTESKTMLVDGENSSFADTILNQVEEYKIAMDQKADL